MNIGLLWFDNGSQRSLKEKIGNAVSHYAQRFGDKPTVCYLHPDTLDADFNSLKGVRLKTALERRCEEGWSIGRDNSGNMSHARVRLRSILLCLRVPPLKKWLLGSAPPSLRTTRD